MPPMSSTFPIYSNDVEKHTILTEYTLYVSKVYEIFFLAALAS